MRKNTEPRPFFGWAPGSLRPQLAAKTLLKIVEGGATGAHDLALAFALAFASARSSSREVRIRVFTFFCSLF